MTTRTKVWDTDKESKRYDAAFYDKHTKYYEKGLKSFQDFIVNDCAAQSLADVGCGMGDWSAPLQEKIPVLGIDFSVGAIEKQQLKPENFLCHDLTVPLEKGCIGGYVPPKTDVVSSLEVYEHILAEHENTYLANLLCFDPRIVILSCAPPGQWGRGHHNPCTPDHVTAKLLERGYVPELVLTQKFSKLKGLASFYRKNTIVFVKSPEQVA